MCRAVAITSTRRKIMPRSFVAFGVFALLGCTAACSSSTGNGSGPVTLDQACTDAAAAVCAKVESCSAFAEKIVYGDSTTCKARVKIGCLASGNAPMTGITPAQVVACKDAYGALACGDLFADNPPPACKPGGGQVADGKACGDDSQCVSKFCGGRTGDSMCSVCGPPPGAGAACVNSKCGPGFSCVNNKCAAPAKNGEACGGLVANCQSGSSCTDGKCVAAAKLGESCSLDGKVNAGCDSLAGLWCNTKTMKCTTAKLVATGTCGLDDAGDITGCTGGGTCKRPDPT